MKIIEEHSENIKMSDSQISRVADIHKAVYNLCSLLAERDDLELSKEYIGEIADFACDILCDMGIRVRYPAIVIDDEGVESVVDFYE